MKKTLGLAALALTGCIFVRAAPVIDVPLEGQSAAFEKNGNHVAVRYEGPWVTDGMKDDYIAISSYGPRSFYNEQGIFVGSGDSVCVLWIGLKFDIANDNDGNPYNNVLKVTAGRCR